MAATQLFHVLDSVDSTNNYAMRKVHAGLATHGMAWFTHEQTAGKGQRGKSWEMQAGHSIALSIVIAPGKVGISQPFLCSAAIANTCFNFFTGFAGAGTSIKWPNDIYFGDRKAGGILIENVFQGTEWKWAIVGIGLNINQVNFNSHLKNAISLQQVTGRHYDTEALARQLHALVLENMNKAGFMKKDNLVELYNEHLYGLNKKVKLRQGNVVFETVIRGVSGLGQLVTMDATERHFDFGTVEWLIGK